MNKSNSSKKENINKQSMFWGEYCVWNDIWYFLKELDKKRMLCVRLWNLQSSDYYFCNHHCALICTCMHTHIYVNIYLYYSAEKGQCCKNLEIFSMTMKVLSITRKNCLLTASRVMESLQTSLGHQPTFSSCSHWWLNAPSWMGTTQPCPSYLRTYTMT